MLEPSEVARWRRLTAAMIRNAGNDDPEALAQVIAVLDDTRAQLANAVTCLRMDSVDDDGRATPGYSWADIAAPLGISRQAAQKRYGLQHALTRD